MNKIKWGVIAAGGIADRRTLPGMMLAEYSELHSVMEVNMEFAEKLRAKYNAKKAYDNYEELLKDPEIDAVYIASPVCYHKEQALAAARAKKHILIEKPLCMTVEDGEEVIRVCRENNVRIAAGFVMRFHAYHQKMRELIAQGKIGQVVSARAQLTCWYPDTPNAWRQNKALSGGGALIDMGIHTIDLIQYVIGSKVKKVAGMVSTNTFKYEVDDQASAILTLENGAFAYIDSNFNIPDAAANGVFEIYGTRGSMLASGTISQIEAGTLKVVVTEDSGYDAQQSRNDVNPLPIEVEFSNTYTKEVDSFAKSLLDGTALAAPAEDAIDVQRVIDAVYESSESGKIITL